MKTEQWKSVVGYEGWYAVSDRGRVKRVRGGAGAQAGYVLRPCPIGGRNKRLHVPLHRDGVRSSPLVARLVAAAFLGELNSGLEVHHIDENQVNDVVSNLEILTPSGHHRHHQLGEKHPNAKLDDDAVRGIRILIAYGWPQWKIAFAYGVCQAVISHVKTGVTWSHVA